MHPVKLINAALLLLSAWSIAACGGDSAGGKSAQGDVPAGQITTVRIGVCPGPYGIMLEKGIAPYLEKKNIKVEVIEFADGQQTNVALESRDLDANLMQHRIYLKSLLQNNRIKGLVSLITVPTLGTAVFSDKYKSLDELKSGDEVLLPVEAVVLARNLRFARDAGLITLKEQSDVSKASLDDIEDNKYGVKFVLVDQPQIARMLDSVEIGFVPGNYAIAAGLDFNDALAIEKVEEDFKNAIVVREDNINTVGQLLREAVQSEDFRNAIEGDDYFNGFDRPAWWHK